MNVNKILEDCAALESVIFSLINRNSYKYSQLNQLQDNIVENSKLNLDQLVEYESKLREELDGLKLQKLYLDNDNNYLAHVNEKLNELVTITNNTEGNHEFDDANYVNILDTIQEYEQIKSELSDLTKDISHLLDGADTELAEVENLVKTNNILAVNLYKNESSIRVLNQQNKLAEGQFDIILNQIPWEPITEDRLAELRGSKDARIRDIADCVEIQTLDIKDLNDSLVDKKMKKLEMLSRMACELDNLVRKRDEALSMNSLQY